MLLIKKLVILFFLLSNTLYAKKAFFSHEELDFILKNTFNVCYLTNVAPLSHQSKDKKPMGTINNLFYEISKENNIKINFIPAKNVQEVEKKLKNTSCDIFPVFIETTERKKHLDFTGTFYKIPYVIATLSDKEYINDLNDFRDKTFLLEKGYALNNKIKKLYKNVSIKDNYTTKESLEIIKNDEAYGFIAPLQRIKYLFYARTINDFKINGNINMSIDFKIATVKSKPLLNSIYENVLSNIDVKKKRNILNYWINELEKKDNYINLTIKQLSFLTIFILLTFLIFSLYWIKRLNKVNKDLQILSTTDSLTKINNRHKLNDLFENEIKRNKKFNTSFSIILLDIDNFKKINDEYGHITGDEVLIEIAELLKIHTRKTDFIGRWGGEEFLIICPNTRLKGVEILSEKIRSKIENFDFNLKRNVTSSFGVVQFTKDETISSLTAKADKALYEAKHSTKNCVIAYEE